MSFTCPLVVTAGRAPGGTRWGAVVLLATLAVGTSHAAEVLYERDIQPLLQQHCYECHNAEKKTADLRFDQRSSVLRGGESGQPAVVAGDSGASEILRRIAAEDPGERMPPEAPALTADQIELIRRWIESGANWPDQLSGDELDPLRHWAFQPVVRPPTPLVTRTEWVRNDVDRFVLAKLESLGVRPSPAANRATLLRRLSLDLIGLPPTVEQLHSFQLDHRPDAYERVVDELLRSPHYGERWGRVWLDAARYADSDGYEKDKVRSVWFYRDWVVQAFNRDLPYDQFIIEQLAGDQLPDPTQDQRVATGFLRNSMINEEGGIDPEQFRMTAMFDRMDAVGKSILGLTIQCGQCHSHKYDPLTQREYYQLFAYLNNDHEANVAVYTPDQERQRADIFGQIDQIEADLMHRYSDWQERLAAWEAQTPAPATRWQTIEPLVDDDSNGGQKYVLQPDGSFLAQGYAPTYHTVLMTTDTELSGITGFRLELMLDPNLPCQGPGRSVLGTAALTEFTVQAGPRDGTQPLQDIAWQSAAADLNAPERPLLPIFDDRSGKKRVTGPIAYAMDGEALTAWSTDAGPGRRNQPRTAVFVAKEPVNFPGGARLAIRLRQDHGGWNSDDNQNHNLGRFRLAVTSDPAPQSDPVPPAVRRLMSIPRAERTAAEQRELFRYWRTTVADWQAENERIEALWAQHPEPTTQLVLERRDQPRATQVLARGEYLQPTEPVVAAVPAFLHDLPADAPPTRLTLAQWLVDRRSPTVARSFVNRVWQAYFGTGLVETPEDLGTRAAPASHPELLDWLAADFMEQGWSIKQLHRTIVTSATYQQASEISDAQLNSDPYNRWLARGPRFRVDAEIVRDIALAVSGLLNPTLGGPSVHPPLPEFMVNPPVSYGPKPWPEDKDANRYRRALYTFRFRSVPYPALEAFDAPNGDVACVRRSRSNTPLQALIALNETVFVECAQALARRVLGETLNSDEERIRQAMLLCVSREPTRAELAELLNLLNQQRQANQQRLLQGATDLPQPDEFLQAAQPAIDTPTYAAWVTVARVLLNLDETVSKE